MKTLLLFIMAGFMYGCSSGKEMQVELVNAELVKIDTVFRYPEHQQVLTWRCSNRVEYVTYVPLEDVYMLGHRMPMLVRR